MGNVMDNVENRKEVNMQKMWKVEVTQRNMYGPRVHVLLIADDGWHNRHSVADQALYELGLTNKYVNLGKITPPKSLAIKG